MTKLSSSPVDESLRPTADSSEGLSERGESTDRGRWSADSFVEEQEAARTAGVSVGTLRRFVEVGALDSVEKEGLVFYSVPLIERLFSVTIPRLRTPLRTAPLPTSPLAQPSASAIEKATHTEQSEQEPNLLRQPSDGTPPSAAMLGQDEVIVFKQVLEAQDKLIVLKDEEIADLKRQRAWLQQRIEKLEQQSDRDRLILLSEAHTIKQLVAIEANRKSRLRATLEFFGIVPMREPIPAPPPLSWEIATTERLSASVDAGMPKAVVTDGRSAEPVRPDGREG